MKRMPSFLVVAALATVLAACNASTGGLGSVPSTAPTPSADPVGPDLTPAPTPSDEPSSEPSSEPSGEPVATPTPAASPAGTTIVRAYFVFNGELGVEGLVPVLRVIPKTTAVAAAAMNVVLSGPTDDEAGAMSSAIPAGSRLLGVTIKNGVATVDLSTEFDSGGGTASMQYRLAQVVYTLTQFTTVRSVVFQIEGQTVTVFGSEGIVLDGPQARADFYDQLPSIFVDRPAYGAAIGNPGRVAGNSNVFEATFHVAIIDAAGKMLVDEVVMATCGTGCRGTFDVSLRYTVSKGQWGMLRAYNLSAMDGSPEDVREYPVWLTPAG